MAGFDPCVWKITGEMATHPNVLTGIIPWTEEPLTWPTVHEVPKNWMQLRTYAHIAITECDKSKLKLQTTAFALIDSIDYVPCLYRLK